VGKRFVNAPTCRDSRQWCRDTRCPSGVTAIMVSRHHFLQKAEWVPDQPERPPE
jgi:hypothetical protein